jgi:hypothetical protein
MKRVLSWQVGGEEERIDEDWHGLEVIPNARSETSVRYVEIGDSYGQRFTIVE